MECEDCGAEMTYDYVSYHDLAWYCPKCETCHVSCYQCGAYNEEDCTCCSVCGQERRYCYCT